MNLEERVGTNSSLYLYLFFPQWGIHARIKNNQKSEMTEWKASSVPLQTSTSLRVSLLGHSSIQSSIQLNNRNLFPHNSGHYKPKIKVRAGLVPSEAEGKCVPVSPGFWRSLAISGAPWLVEAAPHLCLIFTRCSPYVCVCVQMSLFIKTPVILD